jgi:hypothetical protein
VSITRILKRLGQQGMQLVLLAVVVVVTGVGLGLAAGYPVSRIQFEESNAVRLDQQRLAGELDPAIALTAAPDLPEGWAPGDPAAATFGLLGSEFCGEAVDLPTALAPKQAAVFANAADESLLISEVVQVDRWQSASDYVKDVTDAVNECDEFFRTDLEGNRVQVEILESKSDSLITDQVSRTFRTSDGSNVQVWSVMSVGDLIVATQYVGPTGPQHTLMDDLGMAILMRSAPETFAPGGVDASDASTTTVPVAGAPTTVIEGGAADESPEATAGEDGG